MRGESAWVYIMTNRNRTLYVGVTTSLERRVQEHKAGLVEGSFTHRYRINQLVYAERFTHITSAIDREKQVKGWLRIKKIALIVSVNPEWKDLSEEWGQPIAPPIEPSRPSVFENTTEENPLEKSTEQPDL